MGTCFHSSLFDGGCTDSFYVSGVSIYSLLFGQEGGWDDGGVLRCGVGVGGGDGDGVVGSVVEGDGFEDEW